MTGAGKTAIIIGAGIVGVSTAIWLQRDGWQVTLVDGRGAGEGASFGNGGVLASCSIIPVTVPGLLAKAPRMLLDRNQPLFLKWGYLPRLFPWLLRYLAHANAADVRRIAAALHPIVGDSLNDHQALSEGTGAERWVVPSDYLFLYRDRDHFNGDRLGWAIRRNHGFEWQELETTALRDYDPAYGGEIGFAVRVPGHGRISDPGQYVKQLATHVVARGGRLIVQHADAIVVEEGIARGVRVAGEILKADAVVLSAGAWSGPLARQLGLKIPLESERGYHLELWEPNIMPKSPVMVASGKFVATPMEGRLRLAGIVEFGGLESAPSRAPFELLEANIRAAIPGISWREKKEWMGHRPAPSDSIPIIGEAPAVKGAFLGFGHHHVGLTGGPKTGRLLAQLISDRKPNLDLAVYSPKRFQ